MSSYSPNLAITLIDNGSQSGQWGNTTNTNLGTLIEQAISGYVQYACTGGTDTITIPNGATGVARNMYLELTGTGGGTLVVPANKKLYFVYNTTSADITVKVSGQTGFDVPYGNRVALVCDGTDIYPAITYLPFARVDVTNLTVTNLNVGDFTLTSSGSNLAFKATVTYTASISSTTMTVTSVTQGNVLYGQTISGTGVVSGTTVGAQLTSTETAAATPTYASGGAIGDTSFVVDSGTGIVAGQMVSGTGIPTGTYVSRFYADGDTTIPLVDRTETPVAFTVQAAGTYTFAATNGKGTYTVSNSQSILSTLITGVTQVAYLTPSGQFTPLSVSSPTISGEVVLGTGI